MRMYRLRIYSDPASMVTRVGDRVFYSQRDGGPSYRWSDEKGLDQWRYTRVLSCDWKPTLLCHSRRSDMPVALQAKLKAHYLH